MKKQVVNPYLPSWEYVPDGEPHLFGDRVYVYGSHDRFGAPMFCVNDYVAWSAPATGWDFAPSTHLTCAGEATGGTIFTMPSTFLAESVLRSAIRRRGSTSTTVRCTLRTDISGGRGQVSRFPLIRGYLQKTMEASFCTPALPRGFQRSHRAVISWRTGQVSWCVCALTW